MKLKSPKSLSFMLISLSIVILFPIFLTKSYANFKKKDVINSTDVQSASNKQAITDLINNSPFLGTLAVAREGSLLYTEGFGYTDSEQKLDNSNDNLYPIASLQKQMTAVIIGQLIKENKLTYQTTLESFYPNLAHSNTITIQDLLNHTSGYVMPESAPKTVLTTEQEQLENALTTSVYSGDRAYAYSNGNYSLLAGIISQIEGTSYADSLKKRILEPLDLQSTFLWDELPDNKNTPEEYFYEDGVDYATDSLMYSKELMSSLLGAGNVYATPSDLLIFELALSDDTFLTDDEYLALFGLNKSDTLSRMGNISADGFKGGYSSYVYGNLADKNIIVFLANQSSNEATDDLFDTIYQQSLLF